MGVYAVGIDIVEIPRIQELIHRYGERFLRRVFTDPEIRYCAAKARSANSYSARFAAKEAVFKATGLGMDKGMKWRDIEIVNDVHGKPSIRLSGVASQLLANKSIHLSLSHTDTLAIAMVVVENRQE